MKLRQLACKTINHLGNYFAFCIFCFVIWKENRCFFVSWWIGLKKLPFRYVCTNKYLCYELLKQGLRVYELISTHTFYSIQTRLEGNPKTTNHFTLWNKSFNSEKIQPNLIPSKNIPIGWVDSNSIIKFEICHWT